MECPPLETMNVQTDLMDLTLNHNASVRPFGHRSGNHRQESLESPIVTADWPSNDNAFPIIPEIVVVVLVCKNGRRGNDPPAITPDRTVAIGRYKSPNGRH